LARELALDRLERAEAWARGYDEDPDIAWAARKKRNEIHTRHFFLRKVRSRTRPPAEEAAAWFAQHQEEFREPERRRCLLARVPEWDGAEKAARILQETSSPRDALARVSREVANATVGSPDGFTVYQGQFATPIENQLFRLSPGEVTDPFPAEGGFAVARLEEIFPGRTPPFEEVAEKVIDQLGEQAADSLFKSLLSERGKSTPIHVNEEVFRKVRFRPDAVRG
jgi:hypothetical protein